MKTLVAFLAISVTCAALATEDHAGASRPLKATPAAEREPADAKEASARKKTASREVDEAFKKWKATLPPEQQQWESTLEACLGSFYLPLYKKAKVDGTTTAWDYVEDDPKLPRVLIIGDSVSRGYTEAVRKALSGKANVHRAPANCGPTASGVKSLNIWLGDGKWDVITFNFGIHDRATPLRDYGKRLATIVGRLQKTGAKLIWVSTTPLPPKSVYGSDTAIVKLNQAATQLMTKNRIPIADLYAALHTRLAEYQNPNDCHFKQEGYTYLGAEVAKAVNTALPEE
jgi:lysophospholipase L1-like esterase